MKSQGTPTAGKIDAFEGIRGLASVSVLLGHLVIAFWPVLYSPGHPLLERYPGWVGKLVSGPTRVLMDGQFAVVLFFLLSGFVLSLAHFRDPTGGALRSAAARRYLRLMLPAGGSILLAYLVMKWGGMYNLQAAARMNEVVGLPHDWLCYFFNFPPHSKEAIREAVWDTYFTGKCNYNRNLWTMSVELSGSFLVYAFAGLFGTARNRWVFYLVVGGFLATTSRYYMLHFLLGVAVADLYARWDARGRRFALPAPVGLALALAAAYAAGTKPTLGNYTVFGTEVQKSLCHETGAGLLLVAATAFCPFLQRAFGARPFVFLGKLSFTLYLVHLILICSVGCFVYLKLQAGAGLSHSVAALWASGACLAVSFAAAWLMYVGLDRPSIRLASAIYNRWFRPAPPPASAAQTSTGPQLAKAA